MIYTIPIHGVIGGDPEKEQSFGYSDFLLHFNNAQGASIIHLDVSSVGGDCDEEKKMAILLNSFVKNGGVITSSNSGHVASAASKLFMMGSTRTYDKSKGVFLIHNPHGAVEGDSEYMDIASKTLKSIENDYANFYVERTGSNIDVIKAFMKEDKPLTPEQVQDLGFATLVQPQEFKAVAKFNINLNNEQMTDVEIKEGFTRVEKLIEGFKAMFKPKAIMIATEDGELEFPDLTDSSEIAVGVKVNVGGSPANGEFTNADGSVYKTEGGVLTEIVLPVVEEDAEALKAENEALKAELEAIKSEATTNAEALAEASVQLEAQAKAFKDLDVDYKAFKAKASAFVPEAGTPPDSGKKTDKELFNELIK